MKILVVHCIECNENTIEIGEHIDWNVCKRPYTCPQCLEKEHLEEGDKYVVDINAALQRYYDWCKKTYPGVNLPKFDHEKKLGDQNVCY